MRRLADGADPKPFSLAYVGGLSAGSDGLQELERLALTRSAAHERIDFMKWGRMPLAKSPKIFSSNIIGSGMFGYVYLAREVMSENYIPLKNAEC